MQCQLVQLLVMLTLIAYVKFVQTPVTISLFKHEFCGDTLFGTINDLVLMQFLLVGFSTHWCFLQE